jgi:hypothetical protein
MDYFDYVTSGVNYVIDSVKSKATEILYPENTLQLHLNFEIMNTSDIVILLNKLKTSGKPVQLVIDENDKLLSLKSALNLCLESPFDTTTIMLKHIQKHKGEKYKSPRIKQGNLDNDMAKLEERYKKLLEEYKELDEKESDEDDENNNENSNGAIQVNIKKKIMLPC